MNVGVIIAIFGTLTTGLREIKFDLLFSKNKVLPRSGNIIITTINEVANITTINKSRNFEVIYRLTLLHRIYVIISLIQMRGSFS